MLLLLALFDIHLLDLVSEAQNGEQISILFAEFQKNYLGESQRVVEENEQHQHHARGVKDDYEGDSDDVAEHPEELLLRYLTQLLVFLVLQDHHLILLDQLLVEVDEENLPLEESEPPIKTL